MRAIFAVVVVVGAIWWASPSGENPKLAKGANLIDCNSLNVLQNPLCAGGGDCPLTAQVQKKNPGDQGFTRTKLVQENSGPESCKIHHNDCTAANDDQLTDSPCNHKYNE